MIPVSNGPPSISLNLESGLATTNSLAQPGASSDLGPFQCAHSSLRIPRDADQRSELMPITIPK